MAYDPYQFAAARGNIVGGAMQTVGNIASQMTLALGEISQQKIDMKKLANEDYPKLLATATKTFEEEYGIPKTKAAALARRTFLDPSNFKDAREAKSTWINQTGRLDEIASAYSQTLQKQAEKARTESGRKEAQAILNPPQTQTPAGSAMNQIPATQPAGPQPPTLPPVGGATAKGPQWTGEERGTQAATPESIFSQAPAQAPMVPSGSAAAQPIAGRTQAGLMQAPGLSREGAEQLATHPAFGYLPRDEEANLKAEMGKAGDLLDMALKKADVKLKLSAAEAQSAKGGVAGRAGGGGGGGGQDTEKNLDRLEGRVKLFQKTVDSLTEQLKMDQKKLDDLNANTGGNAGTEFEKEQRSALEKSIRATSAKIKSNQESLERADDSYVTHAREAGIDLDFVDKIPQQYLDQASKIVSGLEELKPLGAYQSESGYLGRLVLSTQQAIQEQTGKQMKPEDIGMALATLMDKHRMNPEQAIASLMDYAATKFGAATNIMPTTKAGY